MREARGKGPDPCSRRGPGPGQPGHRARAGVLRPGCRPTPSLGGCRGQDGLRGPPHCRARRPRRTPVTSARRRSAAPATGVRRGAGADLARVCAGNGIALDSGPAPLGVGYHRPAKQLAASIRADHRRPGLARPPILHQGADRAMAARARDEFAGGLGRGRRLGVFGSGHLCARLAARGRTQRLL
ncbi:hypothetical protein D3C86_1054120 [compost metagenome]